MNPGQRGTPRSDGVKEYYAALGLGDDAADPFPVLMDGESAEQLLKSEAPSMLVIKDTEVRKGSRLRLHPRPGGDILDLALAGKIAVVEAIEQDFENNIQLAVTVEDDPGRDLGYARQPGHRFFFTPDEIEPLGDEQEIGR
ncbi:MAG: hypothetical protein JWO42_668 [Chloroflexi bacterium]|nr:hypothetical protein [Chloroflexota bacterium]